MIGEVIMFINSSEMRRAAQIYVDSIYRVPVEVTEVKQVRTNVKGGRFEIKLRATQKLKEMSLEDLTIHDNIDNSNAEVLKEAEEIANNVNRAAIEVKRPKSSLTLEEIRQRAGNTTDAEV